MIFSKCDDTIYTIYYGVVVEDKITGYPRAKNRGGSIIFYSNVFVRTIFECKSIA